jgi:chromosome partitioning protein
MFDNRLSLARQVVEEVKTHFQQMVFNTIINRNTKLGEAPSFGHTIMKHDINSTGAVNYLNLAREIIQNNAMTNLTNAEKEINV